VLGLTKASLGSFYTAIVRRPLVSLGVDYTQLRDSQYRLAIVVKPSFAHSCHEDHPHTRPAVRSILNDRLYLQRRDPSFDLLKVGQHHYLTATIQGEQRVFACPGHVSAWRAPEAGWTRTPVWQARRAQRRRGRPKSDPLRGRAPNHPIEKRSMCSAKSQMQVFTCTLARATEKCVLTSSDCSFTNEYPARNPCRG